MKMAAIPLKTRFYNPHQVCDKTIHCDDGGDEVGLMFLRYCLLNVSFFILT